ncbi:mandelate racemase/muconate lactonizing enzyme family protein [Haloferax sp. YSSS75]|uniref:mandelate racemase/muconate lactonizing enzyme family protein n=1 Tax=Haloferax sp. YSSS75 TaxID=3388564 RepID=UPI00398D6821
MKISGYKLRKIEAPIGRIIGDSQVDPISEFEMVVLELMTDTGEVGVGFNRVNLTGEGKISIETLESECQPQMEQLLGSSPFAVRNQMVRPRGGNLDSGRFEGALDVALWDLCGKHLGLSIAELMGADTDRVPAYASGISFPNDDETTREIYQQFAEHGFTSAKVKVGYQTVEEDIDRLKLVQDILGEDGTLMIDANEAFSPKEALRRLEQYERAGFDVYWFEDPVLRHDVEGARRVAQGASSTHVNVGEYVGIEHTRRLLESGAADIVNLRGLSSGRSTAELAYSYGRPLAVGNTPGDVGVHLGAALPEVTYVEWSAPGWAKLFDNPVHFADNYAHVPDGPGHGLTLDESAMKQYGSLVMEN